MEYRRFALPFFNIVLAAIIAVPILVLKLEGKPFHRGFFCNDETISHPYHPSTVPSWSLYLFGFIFNTILIIVTECFLFFYARKRSQAESKSDLLLIIVTVIAGYLFGAAMSQCSTDATKFSIGRLRPHFIEVCNPDWSAIDCGTAMHPKFVTNYTCQGNQQLFPDVAEREDRIKETHLSFVSGHSSFAFQAVVFCILYLQARFSYISGNFVIPVLQFLLFVLAMLTALSRVSDYKHHSTDVLAGSFLGTLVQMINVIFVMKLFKKGGVDYTYSVQLLDSKQHLNPHEADNQGYGTKYDTEDQRL